MHKPIYTVLAISFSLMLASCAAQQPAPDNNPQVAPSAQVELAPPANDDAEALYAYAVKLEEQGKDADAVAYYLQATQVNPEHIKAQIALAQLYTKLSRAEEAKVAFENVLRLDRDHPFVAQYKEARLKYYSALNIAQNDEFDKALKLLNEAPRNTPLDAEIAAKEKEWQERLRGGSDVRKSQEIIEQASLLAYQGKYQEAMELIRTAPDASTNATVAEKLQQWEKAMQNQPQPNAMVTPPPVTTSGKMQYVQGNDVNLRQSPYLYAESLAALANGTSVEVLLDKGYEADGYQWTKVRTPDGKVGWIAANLLRGSLATTKPVTQATPLPLRPASAAPTTMALPSYGTRYINGDTVNIRRSPSTSGTLVTRATSGSPVILLSERSIAADGYQWSKVKLSDGQIGWVANDFLRVPTAKPPLNTRPPAAAPAAAKPATRFVKGADVNVRSQPSTAGSLIKQVSAPAQVTLTGAAQVKKDGYTWQQVKLASGETGWIVTQFLATAKPVATKPAAAAKPAASTRRYIRGDNVNIRTDASTASAVLIRATEGTPVTLMSATPVKQGGYSWYKIRLADGRLGWVAADFLGQ